MKSSILYYPGMAGKSAMIYNGVHPGVNDEGLVKSVPA